MLNGNGGFVLINNLAEQMTKYLESVGGVCRKSYQSSNLGQLGNQPHKKEHPTLFIIINACIFNNLFISGNVVFFCQICLFLFQHRFDHYDLMTYHHEHRVCVVRVAFGPF